MVQKKVTNLKFGEAREMLEEILKEIEDNEVDVDELADRVRTAAELIRVCKDKLERTKMEVEKVVAELIPRETVNIDDGEVSESGPGEEVTDTDDSAVPF